MNPLDGIHQRIVYDRRAHVLSELAGSLLPRNAHVLDVGCGDGLISQEIVERRPDLTVEGIDVLVRPNTHIPVRKFNGADFPFATQSVDAVMFVDVLHHTNNPDALLDEAKRVTRKMILIKDHVSDGFLAGPTLHFMDWVGNARHGVAIPANYWPEARWRSAFLRLDLTPAVWIGKVPLYPVWASWLFGRSLHFIAALVV